MPNEALTTEELVRLVQSVFRPTAADHGLAWLVDLPDEQRADRPAWAARRELVAAWQRSLAAERSRLGLREVLHVTYRNVRRNNADLPSTCTVLHGARSEELPFEQLFRRCSILLAVTELSATAPLKLQAPRFGFRAATMPGFCPAMVPALRLDYERVHRRCHDLELCLDEAETAELVFEADGRRSELQIDLRHRRATASDGLLREPGRAGNLPSGETYIVPYEGERAGDPSRTCGTLPLQLGAELLHYRIRANRVVEVLGDGPRAAEERAEVLSEPAYANVAELGFGVLAGFGIRPIGELLLDEKLGLHIAFGRSDHFGGQVGARDFSSPDKVVHIDRVYIPELQPRVRVLAVDLLQPGGGRRPLMRDGSYV